MGRGGGCMLSKNRAQLGADGPAPVSDRSISIEGENPSIETSAPIQDGVILQETTNKLRIFIVFYTVYGHIEGLAKRMKKGVDGIEGVEGILYRVPEILAPEVLEQMKVPPRGDEIPVISVDKLVEADGFLFGFPTRYGSMAAQMKAFFDSTGKLWSEQKLAGIPAGFFVSTGTQGGGQETTAMPRAIRRFKTVSFFHPLQHSHTATFLSFFFYQNRLILIDHVPFCRWTAITQLAHHGMIYVPIGYTFGAGMFKMDSVRGGSPYGAGVFSGDGSRPPSETELALAEHQGKYMAMFVKRFAHS